MQTISKKPVTVIKIGNIEASFTENKEHLFLFNEETGEGMNFLVEEISSILENLIAENF